MRFCEKQPRSKSGLRSSKTCLFLFKTKFHARMLCNDFDKNGRKQRFKYEIVWYDISSSEAIYRFDQDFINIWFITAFNLFEINLTAVILTGPINPI